MRQPLLLDNQNWGNEDDFKNFWNPYKKTGPMHAQVSEPEADKKKAAKAEEKKPVEAAKKDAKKAEEAPKKKDEVKKEAEKKDAKKSEGKKESKPVVIERYESD